MIAPPTLLALLLAGIAPAAAPDPFRADVQERTLDNGLRLILAPDRGIPGVAVDIWYGVGSKDERPGRTGLAHLFEHLMFMGSTHVPYPRFDTLMEARGGANNAETGNDTTHYYESGPSNLLPLFLWMEADRLATLPDGMTAEKVSAQRKVVQNERRQTLENVPYGVIEDALPALLWPRPDYPYHWPVIGSIADLDAASDEDVRAFFRAHYVPSNASMVIAGDFEPAEAVSLVEKYFGWMPKRPKPEVPRPAPSPIAGETAVRLADAVALPKVVLAWQSPAAWTPGDAELELAAAILASGETGRLYQKLVYEDRVASEVSALQESLELGSDFQVSALAAKPGADAKKLAGAVRAVVERLAAEGPTDAELAAAKALLLTRLARRLEPLLDRAETLNAVARYLGSASKLPEAAARYRAATRESVRGALARVVAGGRVFIDVEPKP